MKIIIILLLNILFLGCSADTSPNSSNKESKMFSESKKENCVIFSPMEGVLLQNGKPLANTKIIRRLRWNGNDNGLVEEFMTNDKGRFSLPIYEEQLSLGMLNQFVAKAELDAETVEGSLNFWYSSKLLSGIYSETGEPVAGLICDLHSEEIPVYIKESSVPNILTKCRWKNMPIE